MAILSVVYNTDGIRAGIEHTAKIFGTHTETIKNRLCKYLSEGIEKLNSFKQKQSYLNRHRINQVIISVTYENSATAKEVQNYIKEKFSITYCAEAVRKLLIKKQVESNPSANSTGQPAGSGRSEKTAEKYYQMRNEPDSGTLFGDAMHLIHQNFPGLCR